MMSTLPSFEPRLRALRGLLVFDSAVLLALGFALICLPRQVASVFQFQEWPQGLDYVLGLWGCVLATMAIGYMIAAQNPILDISWVQVGIARGAVEFLFGLVCLARGIVTFRQAGFGIILAGLIAIAYLILYPRLPVPTSPEEPKAK